ncbi:MAG: hypothetical protein ACRD0P_26165, partial [Stackebrandtia sp.]
MTYRSPLPPGRDGFGAMLRAEWTKLRTVRGWVVGLAVSALVIAGLGLFMASASVSSCSDGDVEVECPTPPLGPDGEAVDDKFYFVNQPLDGDGVLTVRVTSMTGVITYPPPDHDEIVSGVVPWAKAGLMIKESTKPGAAYAAVMATGDHGVHMQNNFVNDSAGKPGKPSKESPRWLRLKRSGDTITGYESGDGRSWTKVDSVRLELPPTVRIGMFVGSPGDLTVSDNGLAGSTQAMRLATATAVFDKVKTPSGGEKWNQDDIGVT